MVVVLGGGGDNVSLPAITAYFPILTTIITVTSIIILQKLHIQKGFFCQVFLRSSITKIRSVLSLSDSEYIGCFQISYPLQFT